MEEGGGMSLAGKVLKVATVENLPLSGTVTMDNKLIGDGMVFRILKLIEETLNFTHVVVASTNALESVEHGDVDFVPAFLPIPTHNEDGVVYSTPLASEKWVLLMQRPEESLIGTGLLAPFTSEVWMMSLSALILMGPLIYLIIKLRRKVLKFLGEECRVYSMTECVWFTYGAIMKQGSPLEPLDDTTRLLFATWWIFITIFTSYYTANLTAFLTLSRFSLPLEHPEDLISKNLNWFGKSGGALDQAINGDDAELAYLRDSLASGLGQLIECTDQQIIDLVMQGHVYLGELRMIQRLVFKNYQQNFEISADYTKSCTMVYTMKHFLIRPTAFAFARNSSLPQHFNPKLNSLVEGGVIRQILRSDVPESEICPLHLGKSEKNLKLADFTSIYLAVAFGLFVAAAAFAIEKFVGKLVRMKLQMKIALEKKKICYPKDFPRPANQPHLKHIAFIDPQLLISDKSNKSKIMLKSNFGLQFQYLD